MAERSDQNPEFPSALQQAGIRNTRFTGKTLSMEEVRNFSLIRIQALPGAAEPSRNPDSFPVKTGHCKEGDPVILCLGPREWLLISETESAENLMNGVRDMIGPGTFGFDQSDAFTLLRISGAGAPWLLCKLAGLDFLEGSRRGPHCASTKMGHIAAIVHYHPFDSKDVFDLLIERSRAKYLWTLMTESAAHADELATTHGDAT